MAETVEKREGAVLISVPIPLPPQMVDALNEQDEVGMNAAAEKGCILPLTLPSPAFHSNKKVPIRSASAETENLQARLALLESQVAKK